MLDVDQIFQRILTEVGQAELRRVRPLIGSRTLREAAHLLVDVSRREGRIFIPHYWAEYYHDGRGSIEPVAARRLVFFARPADDPRGPTPERQSQVRRLTAAEYQEGLERNLENKLRGEPPHMYVLSSVGPQVGRPFFDRLAKGAASRNGPAILRIFDEEFQEFLDSDPDVRAEKRTARFRF